MSEKQTNPRLEELKRQGEIKDYSLVASNYHETLNITLPSGRVITVKSSSYIGSSTCLDIQ